jgi:hypothetical protein
MFINIVIIIFSFLTLILFFKSKNKKYSIERINESKRYFNGSFEKENNEYTEYMPIKLVMTKVDNTLIFKRKRKTNPSYLLNNCW